MADPEIVRKVAEALASEGCAPGRSIHSWRCEHPDRYGPCDCADDVSRAVLAVAEPLIREQVAQEIEAQVHHDDNSGGTHAPDCWRWHTDCALLHAAGIERRLSSCVRPRSRTRSTRRLLRWVHVGVATTGASGSIGSKVRHA